MNCAILRHPLKRPLIATASWFLFLHTQCGLQLYIFIVCKYILKQYNKRYINRVPTERHLFWFSLSLSLSHFYPPLCCYYFVVVVAFLIKFLKLTHLASIVCARQRQQRWAWWRSMNARVCVKCIVFTLSLN